MPGELILVVEDNDNNRMLIRDVLQATGYRVVEAENAEDGLRAAAEQRPALILMDIQLPGMDGIQALHRLRAEVGTAAIPVLAVTASAMTQDRRQILAAGFDGYQAKPIRCEGFTAERPRDVVVQMTAGAIARVIINLKTAKSRGLTIPRRRCCAGGSGP
jgi:two-component system cell cycle response regulator DivK